MPTYGIKSVFMHLFTFRSQVEGEKGDCKKFAPLHKLSRSCRGLRHLTKTFFGSRVVRREPFFNINNKLWLSLAQFIVDLKTSLSSRISLYGTISEDHSRRCMCLSVLCLYMYLCALQYYVILLEFRAHINSDVFGHSSQNKPICAFVSHQFCFMVEPFTSTWCFALQLLLYARFSNN